MELPSFALPQRPAAVFTGPVSASILFLVYLLLALFGCVVSCAPAPDPLAARHRQMIGLVQKFDRFDANGDGYLTRQEIRDGLREAGTLTLTPAELDQVMAAYDLNHDQRISHHEAQLGADRGPKIFDKNP